MDYARLIPLFLLLTAAPLGAGETPLSVDSAAGSFGVEPADRGELTDSGWPEASQPAAIRSGPSSRVPLRKGVFLIASESLSDPNFSQSVVLLLEYDQTGAVGLIINRPTNILLASLLPEEEGLRDRRELVFIGGPVGRAQLFLLLRSKSPPRQSERITDGIYASTSFDTLRDVVAEESAVAAFQAYAGYSGWGPGQLDAELMRGDWLVTPADSETVFDRATDTIWPELIRKYRGVWVRRTPHDTSLFAVLSRPNNPEDFH